jgi:deazaflavin-dependent oxidoreductase (nitroreductase family)
MSKRVYKPQDEKNALDRGIQAFAQTRLGGLLFVTVFPAIDRRLMPLTGGRVRISMSTPSLILHARGAKSGAPRETPLVYTPQGADYILVASRAGAAHNPAWYHNLIAHPDVEVEIRGRRIPVRARELHGEERAAAWRLANDNYNGYETYQQRAGSRTIPVILLEPR